MTDKNVFTFSDYKAYLSSVEDTRKSFERGFRTKLASAIGCQSGFVSNVLNGDAHFSSEQITGIARFLNLKSPEQKYLYTLLQFARAGTKDLQNFIQAELTLLRDEYLNIKKRVGDSKALSESDQSVYYSSWHYTAVHLLTTIPGYQTAERIAEGLNLPYAVVNKILLFLVQTGILVENKKGELEAGNVLIHLNRESPHIRQHHTNWRVAAIQSLALENADDLHYSTISTLSRADAEKLKAEMVRMIESYVETVKPSKEEEMVGFTLDFFRLIKK